MEFKRRHSQQRSRKRTPNYLTKRILVRAARSGGVLAAKRAMEIMGYIVVAENSHVVRKYADGRSEQIEAIRPTPTTKVAFD
jgi:hypothetical protein